VNVEYGPALILEEWYPTTKKKGVFAEVENDLGEEGDNSFLAGEIWDVVEWE